MAVRGLCAAVRSSVDTVEPLADEAHKKERRVRELLRRPSPDAAAIGPLVIELDACCKKIERIRTDRPLIHSPLGRRAVERRVGARTTCAPAGHFTQRPRRDHMGPRSGVYPPAPTARLPHRRHRQGTSATST